MAPPTLSSWGLAALELCAALGLCLQVIHAVLVASMRERGQRLLPIAISACMIIHLALAADMVAALDWQASPFLASVLAARGMLAVLWMNLPLAIALGLTMRRFGDRLWLVVAILTLAATPPVADTLGPWWNLLAVCDLCAYLALETLQLRRDIRLRHAAPTSASVAEAMNVISVGMLVTDGRGGSVFMNDSMRSELEGFGLPTDLGNLNRAWKDVRAHAVTLADLGVKNDALLPLSLETTPNRTLLQTPDGRVLLGLIESPSDGRHGTRAFSLDITQLVDAARRLSAANEALEQANDELNEQLMKVRAVAQQTAFLRMRANVHDVIGQRLSILQRYLDEGRIDEESVAQLRELMESVVRDLREASGANPDESLGDVVRAFTLVNVNVEVRGTLPSDRAVSGTLVKVVREASTNACRHAQAQTVWVDLGRYEREGRRWATLEIHDDGFPIGLGAQAAAGPIREGTGIAGMRHSVEKLGGNLLVNPGPPFTVSARIPLR